MLVEAFANCKVLYWGCMLQSGGHLVLGESPPPLGEDNPSPSQEGLAFSLFSLPAHSAPLRSNQAGLSSLASQSLSDTSSLSLVPLLSNS